MVKKSVGQMILEGAAGLAIGYALGELTNAAYDSMTSEQKREHQKNRIMHHGEAGCFVTAAGIGAKSAPLAGFGVGLMISDMKDAGEWFSMRKAE
jgi:hypothetical protein